MNKRLLFMILGLAVWALAATIFAGDNWAKYVTQVKRADALQQEVYKLLVKHEGWDWLDRQHTFAVKYPPAPPPPTVRR